MYDDSGSTAPSLASRIDGVRIADDGEQLVGVLERQQADQVVGVGAVEVDP